MNLFPPRRTDGFTVVELLVTTTVLVIVLAYAIPAFTGLMGRARLTAITNTLIGHLQFARSAAVRSGRDRVAVGPCDNSGNWLSGNAWAGGYMVATVAQTGTPTVIKVLRRVDGADLASATITINGSSPRFYFHPDGTSSVSATLSLCDKANPANARAVVVDNVGRIRVSNYVPGGGPITCPPP